MSTPPSSSSLHGGWGTETYSELADYLELVDWDAMDKSQLPRITVAQYNRKVDALRAEFDERKDKCKTCGIHHCGKNCCFFGNHVQTVLPSGDPKIIINEDDHRISLDFAVKGPGIRTEIHGASVDCGLPIEDEIGKLCLRIMYGDERDPKFDSGFGVVLRHFDGIAKGIHVMSKKKRCRMARCCSMIARTACDRLKSRMIAAFQKLANGDDDEVSLGEADLTQGIINHIAGRVLIPSMCETN